MKWLHGLIVLGVMVSAARGQEPTLEKPPGASASAESGEDDVPCESQLGFRREERRSEYVKEAEAALADSVDVPDWVEDAIWYYIDVPRFRDGNPSNNGADTPEWGLKRSDGMGDGLSSYGGDLQGVKERLPYLKSLGVNAIILDHVFPAYVNLKNQKERLLQTLHVRDTVAVSNSLSKVAGETLDPKSWKFTESDELLLDVIAAAQEQGFRVIVEYPHPTNGSGCTGPPLYFYDYSDFIWQMNERWVRKSRESKDIESRGIDGWSNANIYSGASRIFAMWRKRIRAINPQASLVGLNQVILEDEPLRVPSHADALIYTEPVDALVNFFERNASRNVRSLFDELGRARRGGHRCIHERPNGKRDPHFFNCLDFALQENGSPKVVEAAKVITPEVVDRWRLAIVFQLLYSNDYVIPFGEEVGMVHEGPPWYPEPMWWTDLPNPESKRPTYRGDFYALIQMLNTFRARFAPLRRGDFKPVFADDEKKLLAFARTMPGDEVILVMNYGDTKQSVSLTVGQPGELVPVLSPQLKPMPMPRKGQPAPPEPDLNKIPELRVGAQREFVKPNGTIDFWVDPMGVRIVLVGDSARGGKK